jgi:DHA1 family bicyclomycin/chloramphenicol resistance-like MFS transporter
MNQSPPAAADAGNSPGLFEFVALMAFAMSLGALTIDSMLPAFDVMRQDLMVARANDIQLIVSFLLVGLAFGQPFFGPLADAIGRKRALYVGFALFILGCLLSMLATNFDAMLAGRVLQGIGAAGARVVVIALVRDRVHGSAMARVMSFVMTIFILVPIIAPAMGQAILLVAGWRAIFATLTGLAAVTLIWLALRQPETLALDQRLPLSLQKIVGAFVLIGKNRQAMLYTLVIGCISGAFFAYLNLCQQIFQVQYGLERMFPLYFAILAVFLGMASLLNGSLVMRLGMHYLARSALLSITAISWVFLALSWFNAGHPPLVLLMLTLAGLFFCVGLLFGNLNAIAMEFLGHNAGTGAAVVGSLSTFLAVGLAWLIGHTYDGTVSSLATGFAGLTTASLALTRLVPIK